MSHIFSSPSLRRGMALTFAGTALGAASLGGLSKLKRIDRAQLLATKLRNNSVLKRAGKLPGWRKP